MKKIISIVMVMIILASFTACGENGDKVDMSFLEKQMIESDPDLPGMMSVDSKDDDAKELFTYISDYDYSKVDEFFLEYASEGEADEIVVIKVKKSSDTVGVIDTLKKHNEERISFYKSYDTTQVERASSALIFSKGKYAVLIVSDRASDIKATFEKLVA